MTAPFAPGSRVLHRHYPREALAVASCDAHPDGGWTVRCTTDAIPGLSVISESAPDDRYIPASAGWQNPPIMPAGYRRRGLPDDEARLAAEDADLNHQIRWRDYHIAMAEWAETWLALVDADDAAHERYGSLMLAELCQQRIEALTALPIAAE